MKCKYNQDGNCILRSDNTVIEPCIEGPCPDEIFTNADRIRAMNDEELAELLCTADWCEVCDQTRENGTCKAMELEGPLCVHCVAAGLRWLRQPVRETQE